jgi:hypothetical protein
MLGKAVTAICCVAVLAGCGASDEEQVAEVVRDYNRALTEADADKACGLTVDEMWVDIRGTCENFVRTLGGPSDAGTKLAEGEYEVTIDGDTATAQGRNLGIFTLRKVDGDWKLTSAR